jgi:uncharacterized protein
MSAESEKHGGMADERTTGQEPDAGEARLAAILRSLGSVCIGYSGGVDSVYLAAVAVDVLGSERVLAVTGTSDAYPEVQRTVARDVAARFAIPHLEIGTDELSDERYTANPTNRCYHCKTELWSKLARLADDRGFAAVLDGSNADDASDYRPGMKAARERAVRSPLLEAGLSKDSIRALSRRRGLPTWDQPSAPCLSSRLPYGLQVTPERLRAVESAEDALRALGFRQFRVRHHGDAARIEISPAEMRRAVGRTDVLRDAMFSAGFSRALLDVEGYRSGALNASVPLVQLKAS